MTYHFVILTFLLSSVLLWSDTAQTLPSKLTKNIAAPSTRAVHLWPKSLSPNDSKSAESINQFLKTHQLPPQYLNIFSALDQLQVNVRKETFLELGAGDGQLVTLLRKLGPLRVTGLDSQLPSNSQNGDLDQSLIQGYLQSVREKNNLPFFGITYSNNFLDSIDHTPDSQRKASNTTMALLAEIALLTRPGGYSIHQTQQSIPFTNAEFQAVGLEIIYRNESNTFVVLKNSSFAEWINKAPLFAHEVRPGRFIVNDELMMLITYTIELFLPRTEETFDIKSPDVLLRSDQPHRHPKARVDLLKLAAERLSNPHIYTLGDLSPIQLRLLKRLSGGRIDVDSIFRRDHIIMPMRKYRARSEEELKVHWQHEEFHKLYRERKASNDRKVREIDYAFSMLMNASIDMPIPDKISNIARQIVDPQTHSMFDLYREFMGRYGYSATIHDDSDEFWIRINEPLHNNDLANFMKVYYAFTLNYLRDHYPTNAAIIDDANLIAEQLWKLAQREAILDVKYHLNTVSFVKSASQTLGSS